MVETADILRYGDLEVEGRLVIASNLTMLASARLDDVKVRCVYKPIAGERPLWDFPDGTLAAREVAAYAVSEAAGWGLVPVTVLRDDGPLGAGMCQEWIEQGDDAPPWVEVLARNAVDDGVIPILEAVDGDGEPVVVAHRDTPALRTLAVFDIVVNNADRKGGHILHTPGTGSHSGPDGVHAVLGVDHGVSFHIEPKLRTVLWGWAGQRLNESERTILRHLRASVSTGGPLRGSLTDLLAQAEIDAIATRVDALLTADTLPHPHGRMPVPWPVL